ncbi:MAG: acetyl-CoA carboxylase biotin carboxylase subunit [Chloroflexota bacterium]
MIRSVLVANRGEIAVRIIRTCRQMGIRTVAIHSDADRTALHVLHADEAYSVGPSPARESYLNQAAILRIALQSGVEAIHPGYGFLAENAEFADAVITSRIIWIGPPAAAMRMLGEKAPAKALAQRLGVPVLPGYHGDDQHPEHLAERAAEIGYPLLIKASAGGGGRGMRLVESSNDFGDALEAAKREAQSSFGNEHILLEKLVLRPRHVEVQIFGDAHGNVVHLGERECSIQRRHQKLLEESPSPAVDPKLRARMGNAAVGLARAAGYQSAGTVEFLLDERLDFYFLELNARLQVEHPVTEMVTGLDLVEMQIQVASGEPLTIRQEDVHLSGHAIEVRIIAEDPLQGFLPSSGQIDRWCLPNASESVRVDSGFRAGLGVSPFYDSLLAKLVVWAPDRPRAVTTLQHALTTAHIAGPETNLDLLLGIAEHHAFVRGDLHTDFLDEHLIIQGLTDAPAQVLAAASVMLTTTAFMSGEHQDPWRRNDGWRFSGVPRVCMWNISSELTSCTIFASAGASLATALVNGQSFRAQILDAQTVLVDDDVIRILTSDAEQVSIHWQGRTYRLRRTPPPDTRQTSSTAGAGDGTITAPMPGRIVKLHVAQGQPVTAHQAILALEAMKMEHVVSAPHAGIVTRLHVSEGEQVTGGAVLAELEAELPG